MKVLNKARLDALERALKAKMASLWLNRSRAVMNCPAGDRERPCTAA